MNSLFFFFFFLQYTDALVAVAQKFLASVDIEEHAKKQVVQTCQFIHTNVRELSNEYKIHEKRINYVTPTSYLELIRSFQACLGNIRSNLQKQQDRYEVGKFKESEVQLLFLLLPTIKNIFMTVNLTLYIF